MMGGCSGGLTLSLQPLHVTIVDIVDGGSHPDVYNFHPLVSLRIILQLGDRRCRIPDCAARLPISPLSFALATSVIVFAQSHMCYGGPFWLFKLNAVSLLIFILVILVVVTHVCCTYNSILTFFFLLSTTFPLQSAQPLVDSFLVTTRPW